MNKVNVLDKGFVALLEASCTGKQLQDLQDTYFKTKVNLKLLSLCSATLIIKCPLFVQLNLAQFGFNLISTPSDKVEAFIPNVSDIDGNTLEDRQEIEKYIRVTTEALLLNSKGMEMDGGDSFTAQLLTPISIYNELIVNGSLREWVNFLNQKNLPDSMGNYQKAVSAILSVEWRNLEDLQKILK